MEKRRPFARPYSTQLGCCSPDWHAWQLGRMHGARRRLSEPRIAGKTPEVWLSSQRLTSAGDSVLLILTCALSHTCLSRENSPKKHARNTQFYVLSWVSRQKLVRLRFFEDLVISHTGWLLQITLSVIPGHGAATSR